MIWWPINLIYLEHLLRKVETNSDKLRNQNVTFVSAWRALWNIFFWQICAAEWKHWHSANNPQHILWHVKRTKLKRCADREKISQMATKQNLSLGWKAEICILTKSFLTLSGLTELRSAAQFCPNNLFLFMVRLNYSK